MELTTTLPMVMALVTILIVLVLSPWRRRRKALNLPLGPRGWPVLGSLGALAGALPPHRALAALAARHGPLMHLRLGSYHAVVASSADAARRVLKTHDLAFADRPPTTAGEHVAYGYRGVQHTPYGTYWRMARRLCATELFSGRRVDSYEYIRRQEVRALVCGLFQRGGRAVAVREHLVDATLRNVLRMSVGDKWSGCYGSAEGEEFRRAREEVFAVAGAVSNVGEWVPWLGWLDLQGGVRRMKRLSKVYDRLLESILDDHDQERHKAATASSPAATRDLVDVLLQQLAEEEGETDGSSIHGSQAHARRRQGLRPGHHSRWHGELCGGHGVGHVGAPAPAGRRSRLPDEFRPERFAGSVVDVRGQHFELLPFGAGRRMCPAYGLALKVIGTGLANLLHGFAWRLPDGVSPEDVRMEELFGVSTRKKVPFIAVPEPRLPVHLYAAVD